MVVTIQFPLFDELDEFRMESLELFGLLAGYAHGAIALEDIDELTAEGLYHMWRKITSALLTFPPARDKGMAVFFRYLAPYVEEIEEIDDEILAEIAESKGVEVPTRSIQRSDLWLRGNICAKTATQMLVAILCVNDYIKKNAICLLQKIFQVAIQQPSEAQSPKPKAHPQILSGASPHLKSGFGFAD